ncbi:MAG: UDP-4-amino-4,6-dideoxy-N-acetyl-beta-L-altrosamine transaminase [Lachnospiraceae bacterium]|nr:UDP-4-amino-4,6-dideoxy-N-acetyl-beta-L-altrosamine transaminase [Lachnospiraceae bacterium]MDY5869933.1 UDP-4-amino-4,6-dideoxy-N-acetyl-beta-L-altrosamine transaminase [Lachnospiraceae bacterium]
MEKPAICGGTPVRDTKIFYGHQYIDDDDIKAVVDVMKSDYLTCGPKIAELEQKLCRVTGAKYAVVCSNGTAALHIAALAAGVQPGDEVITTPITFAASANCALYCGARPVFADINEETYNIDPACVEALTTKKTKAVVAVDYTGQSVELDRLLAHCHKNNIVLIEDGAHVIGTRYNGKFNGSIADMTTLSFHPVKTVTCGEGGAVLTNSETFYKKLLLYRSHGITRDEAQMEHEPDGSWYYEQIALGYNYRMTDMQAALLISQLDKLPAFSKRRKEIVKAYNEAFSKLPQLVVQKEIPESDTTRHLYILRLNPDRLTIGRKEFFDALAAENICCNVHYIPTYYFPYYEKLGYHRGLCPKAEKLYEEIISLPLYYAMSDQDVQDVIEAVTKIAEYYKA